MMSLLTVDIMLTVVHGDHTSHLMTDRRRLRPPKGWGGYEMTLVHAPLKAYRRSHARSIAY